MEILVQVPSECSTELLKKFDDYFVMKFGGYWQRFSQDGTKIEYYIKIKDLNFLN
jgi:hypothetical protein